MGLYLGQLSLLSEDFLRMRFGGLYLGGFVFFLGGGLIIEMLWYIAFMQPHTLPERKKTPYPPYIVPIDNISWLAFI